MNPVKARFDELSALQVCGAHFTCDRNIQKASRLWDLLVA